MLIADYWIVKEQKINIPALYDPDGCYRYWYGINWRALVAFLLTFTRPRQTSPACYTAWVAPLEPIFTSQLASNIFTISTGFTVS